MPPAGRQFKVKLASGRVLGPLDLERIRRLIKKKHIVGIEVAKLYPDGEWVSINQIEEIAEVFVALIQASPEKSLTPVLPAQDATQAHPHLPGATQLLNLKKGDQPGSSFQPIKEKGVPDLELEQLTQVSITETQKVEVPEPQEIQQEDLSQTDLSFYSFKVRNPIAEAQTVVFQRSGKDQNVPGKQRLSFADQIKVVAMAVALGVLGYDFVMPPPAPTAVHWTPIRPQMPNFKVNSEPQKSAQLYGQAIKVYLQDTLKGYQQAVKILQTAAALDSNNVKALTMLASSYLNLIDSSNKDENYFRVISKLIDMSRAKNLDLPETVIADVEYYIFANKAEAAQNRIVEYTKTHQSFGQEMFYYIALTFFSRGDFQSAVRYLGQIADNQVFSPKVYYLRGQLAEKFDQSEGAIREYEKAIQLNSMHARSHLRIAQVMNRQGQLKNATKHLEWLTSHSMSLAPQEMAQAYYLHALLSQIDHQWDIALGDMERATQLDKGNHDYLLEMYTLRSKAGDRQTAMRMQGRMYYFLSEGEKLLREGKIHEALTQFLSAKQSNDRSPIPHIKIGDMFTRLNQLQDARINYKMAADRAPNSIEVWSKYIDVLIKSYEWGEAIRAMDKFRKLPVPQSTIDKAAADMYAKQGRHLEAIKYYQKAMGRDSIDPSVYTAYAQSLMAIGNYKDAPFFFALALRFDPLNSNALIGTAQCIAASESIDRAINMLQDELQKDSIAKAEIFAGIAEFQIQKGEWDQAQANLEQSMTANPDYAQAWKLQARIYINQESTDRTAIDKALQAYQSFSDRNPSDSSGYLERYKLFIKKMQYEKAGEELDKIFAIYPKYPNLHYYKGALYSVMRNQKQAISEYLAELKNNPNSMMTLKGLAKEFVDAAAPAEALKYLSKAMELNPKDPEAKADAAYANYLLKNFTAAIGLYRAALVYDPANPLLYKRLGIAFREAGDQASAASSFKKYLELEPDAPDRGQLQNYR